MYDVKPLIKKLNLDLSNYHPVSNLPYLSKILEKALQWGVADAEIKVPSGERTQSLNILPLKPGVGQCIAIHVTLTSTDFFLAYFYPFGPFTYIFSRTSSDFPCVGCGCVGCTPTE